MNRSFPFVRAALPIWFEPVLEKVEAKMSDDATGHDFLHVVRVMELAGAFARQLGEDADAAMAAGLLHDYYRKEEKQTGRLHYGPEAMADLDREFGHQLVPHFQAATWEQVLAAIARHEEDRFDRVEKERQPLPLLLQILQDADRIEAIGAVGVARTFMFGGAHGLQLADDRDISPDTRFDPGLRPQGSVHRHFYEKLLHVKDGMHTLPGRELAEERHRFMLMFVERLEAELEMDKGRTSYASAL
ncbi:HD domain-containing protein [Paenibacillus filicis]|uniref:HD domain-containing protein n=1 Tax=Paenibacillus filicis TaxID=669464 RepID=A0ABU9DD04_9BACL